MFVRVNKGIPLEWPVQGFQIRSAYKDRSFPNPTLPEHVADLGFEPYEEVEAPAYDARIQRLQELPPIKGADGIWRQTWQINELYEDPSERERIVNELALQAAAMRVEKAKVMRRLAYAEEADPLYFKAQRGEAALNDWKAKVEEIRARYPYPS